MPQRFPPGRHRIDAPPGTYRLRLIPGRLRVTTSAGVQIVDENGFCWLTLPAEFPMFDFDPGFVQLERES